MPHAHTLALRRSLTTVAPRCMERMESVTAVLPGTFAAYAALPPPTALRSLPAPAHLAAPTPTSVPAPGATLAGYPPLPPLHAPPAAFTRADIEAVRRMLLPPPLFPVATLPPHNTRMKRMADAPERERSPRDAAVLIPLCNIGGRASLLMEIRAARMRTHAGEASFPGGRCEDTDQTLVDSALRETEEEIALDPANVEILGGLPPEYSLGNRSRVWPVIGFVHASPLADGPRLTPPEPSSPAASASASAATSSTLPSLSIATLTPEPGEVAALLPLPLSSVADPARQVPGYFRLNGRWPYWKIRADDHIVPPPPERLEVWGLTGWFLSRLCLRMGWADAPAVSLPTDAEGDAR